MFACDVCAKTFTLKHNMLRHKKTHEEKKLFVCDGCSKSFARKSNMNEHKTFHCRSTTEKSIAKDEEKPANDGFVEIETALKNRIKTFSIQPSSGDLQSVLPTLLLMMVAKFKEMFITYSAFKFNIFVECEFTNPTQDEICNRNLKTRNVIAYKTSDILNLLNTAFDKIYAEKSECQLKNSGWSFKKIVRVELRINKYNPLRGARFLHLPKSIANKKAVINVKNTDEFCFKYAMLSKYVQNSNPDRVSSYIELEDKYNWSCITYPARLDDVKHFEKANNVSINIFGLDDRSKVYPIKICDEETEDHTDLLYISNAQSTHYCYISNFEALVRDQITKRANRIEICKRCFAHFDNQLGSAQEKLEAHKELCSQQDAIRCGFPTDDSVTFKNHHRSKKVRFVIYADFETLLEPVNTCLGNPTESWTDIYQRHVPYSYSYYLKDSENEYTRLREYRGPDAVTHFMKSIVEDTKLVDEVLYGNKQLDVPTLTPEQQEEFDNAKVCHICKKGDFNESNCKVRNHCHVSGDYLGVAHRHCNLFHQDQHFLPCLIHNLSGYDGHMIIRELGYDKENISVIPNTEEKYISFSKSIRVKHARNNIIQLRFLDSFRFMPSSLSTLASNLPKEEFHETKKVFSDKLDLVTKKGIFPYEYITDVSKLDETKLPPKSSFYSRLSDEHITEESYQHAQKVWTEFNVKTLGEYSDVYVKTDVLILCDIFEEFRKTCMKTYDLDPAYYYTVPGLAWEAMLKHTGIELELLKDMDMVLMIEKGIRGGITQCVKRYSKANNKYLPETFDKSKPSKYLMYIDSNSLYGMAMIKHLPTGGFEWCDPLDITTVPEDSEEGYILEVDLEYPKELHDKHRDFPFCTETKVPPGGKTPKLLASVENKKKYVIHYVALQQALRNGLQLQKIHRVLKFKQSCWLKPFIDLNTKKRTEAKNIFEKDFYKLMSNSIYGKCVEQVRNRLDIKLVSDPKKVEKLIAKSNFIDRTVYNENLVAVHMKKTNVTFNKPIYVGMSILDLSKTHMYSFHYDVMLPFYGDRIRLCYQDTDSFIYEIITDDLYEDMKSYLDHLDTSDYPSNHPLFSLKNKKVLGKFKDEVFGDIIVAFVGLRSKMYAIMMKQSSIKKIKGIKKSVIKGKVNFEDYVNCLFNEKPTYTCNNFIRSSQHKLHTVAMNKVTLSSDDDKRVVLDDKINTLPHGHWRLEEIPTKRIKLSG